MSWAVEYTDEFGRWWESLNKTGQDAVDRMVRVLETLGPGMPFPYSSGIQGSKHSHMRELRIQHKGEPLRVLYAFDPRRIAILLIGGNKGGNNRWYEQFVPVADKLYDAHVVMLEKEELL